MSFKGLVRKKQQYDYIIVDSTGRASVDRRAFLNSDRVKKTIQALSGGTAERRGSVVKLPASASK
jgi:hypothetical protein